MRRGSREAAGHDDVRIAHRADALGQRRDLVGAGARFARSRGHLATDRGAARSGAAGWGSLDGQGNDPFNGRPGPIRKNVIGAHAMTEVGMNRMTRMRAGSLVSAMAPQASTSTRKPLPRPAAEHRPGAGSGKGTGGG